MRFKTVPYVVAWSEEMTFDVRVCPWAGNRPALWQPNLPGQGQPQFERLHVVRQRQCIAEDRCPICAEHTDPDDRVWFGLGRSDVPRGDGTNWPWASVNSGYHRACAEVASEMCPHLGQRSLFARPMPTPSAIWAAHLAQVGPSMQGLDLQPGQTVISNLFLVWREKPKGAM